LGCSLWPCFQSQWLLGEDDCPPRPLFSQNSSPRMHVGAG
jgi:hypothetical protein